VRRNEEKINQIKLFEEFIKDSPKILFNTNVFKNVKFAPETLEEVQTDEVLVTDLAKYLKEVALEKLVKDLSNVEGVPTDSESLQ
jgi:hypothetical protein